MKTTLIICAKNEEGSIRAVIRSAKPFVGEIIAADGHTDDHTAVQAEKNTFWLNRTPAGGQR